MKRLPTLLSLVILGNSSAAANRLQPNDVIDLGEMSIEGEIRRPAITWIDSQKSVKEMIPFYLKPEFEAFEKELLEPAEGTENGTDVK